MENEEVVIIYCKCGKNAIAVGNPDFIDGKEISNAIKEKRKIEVVDFAKYQEMDITIYCPEFVKENNCPNNEVIIINEPHTEDFSDITNIEETNINVKSDISIFCEGEKCSVCKKQATHKIKEVIFDDDPLPTRHAKSNYVCTEHFNTVICPYMINQQLKERSYTEIDMINAIKAGRQLYLYESDGSLQEWLENYKKNN